MEIIKHIVDAAAGKHPLTTKRSNHWPAVRKQHLATQPCCELCGSKVKVDVHHIRPFHLHPQLELEPTNLITLCEANKGGANCHLLFGHLGNFKSFNETVIDDCKQWSNKITNRPLHDV